jgi:hypothetical protein
MGVAEAPVAPVAWKNSAKRMVDPVEWLDSEHES